MLARDLMGPVVVLTACVLSFKRTFVVTGAAFNNVFIFNSLSY
jgi:hypothetical protein